MKKVFIAPYHNQLFLNHQLLPTSSNGEFKKQADRSILRKLLDENPYCYAGDPFGDEVIFFIGTLEIFVHGEWWEAKMLFSFHCPNSNVLISLKLVYLLRLVPTSDLSMSLKTLCFAENRDGIYSAM